MLISLTAFFSQQAWSQLISLPVFAQATKTVFFSSTRPWAFAPLKKARLCPFYAAISRYGISWHFSIFRKGRAARTLPGIRHAALPSPFEPATDEGRFLPSAWLAENSATFNHSGRRCLWFADHDKVVEPPPTSGRSEHSAYSSAELDLYTKEIREGDINVLSCSRYHGNRHRHRRHFRCQSMNNVPPHPANYLQRSGRSGCRRGNACPHLYHVQG